MAPSVDQRFQQVQRIFGWIGLVAGIGTMLFGLLWWPGLIAGALMTLVGVLRVRASSKPAAVTKDPDIAGSVEEAPPLEADEVVLATHRKRITRGWLQLGIGAVAAVLGTILMFAWRTKPGASGVEFAFELGVYSLGYVVAVIGLFRLMNARAGLVKPHTEKGKRNEIAIGVGFRTFVAWRYLMGRHHRLSRVVLGVFFFALWGTLTGLIAWKTCLVSKNALTWGEGVFVASAKTALISMIAGVAMMFVSILTGLLRLVFSFFTTVPVVGVWIGTAALICVLSVMSGFESDLRQKILGSNAHIQITADSGDIANWRELMDRINHVPGVIAATPYAQSEVVIAANNNGMPVIIKGIDPATVGKVTKLVDSIRDDKQLAMKRLYPLIDDTRDLTVPQSPKTNAGSGSDVLDPAPDDVPEVGEPIDFSAPEEAGSGSDTPSVPPPPPPGMGSAGGSDSGSIRDGYGGDAQRLLDAAPAAGSGASAGSAAGTGSGTGTGTGTGPHADLTRSTSPRAARGGDGNVRSGTAGPIIVGADADPSSVTATTAAAGTRSRSGIGAGSGAMAGSAATGSAATGSAATGSAATGSAATVRAASGAGSAAGSDDDFDDDHAIDAEVTFEPPTVNRRTQSLPGVLVGAELVKQTHMYVGQEVRVVSPLSDPSNPDATGTPIPFNRDYRVAGVFFTGMYEYDLKYVYVTLDSLQDFLDRGEAIDGIEVRIGSPDDTDRYVRTLQAMLDQTYGKQKYRVQDWKELNRSLFSALKLEKIAMFLVLGIVILVASFSIVGNLIMVVVEKGREIALLKTLGAADHNVMAIFAIQGLMIGLFGTGLGVATGLAACTVGKTYGIPLNPDVYYIDKMPVNVETSSVVITACAGVLISILATFYPAIVAARVRPAAGMRH